MIISNNRIIKLYIKFISRPLLSYSILFLLVGIFGVLRNEPEIIFLYSIYFPWIILFVFVLNFPLFYTILNKKILSKEEKINHVLEHGTIYQLKNSYTGKHKIGGSSAKNGFRVFGQIDNKKDIEEAFERMMKSFREGDRNNIISKACGSNIFACQGYALILLATTFLLFMFFNFDILKVTFIMTANIVLYILLAIPVGNYIQKRRYMNYDFSDAKIVSIQKVNKKRFIEKNPVYFAETAVFY